jgi:hypothetical protein
VGIVDDDGELLAAELPSYVGTELGSYKTIVKSELPS